MRVPRLGAVWLVSPLGAGGGRHAASAVEPGPAGAREARRHSLPPPPHPPHQRLRTPHHSLRRVQDRRAASTPSPHRMRRLAPFPPHPPFRHVLPAQIRPLCPPAPGARGGDRHSQASALLSASGARARKPSEGCSRGTTPRSAPPPRLPVFFFPPPLFSPRVSVYAVLVCYFSVPPPRRLVASVGTLPHDPTRRGARTPPSLPASALPRVALSDGRLGGVGRGSDGPARAARPTGAPCPPPPASPRPRVRCAPPHHRQPASALRGVPPVRPPHPPPVGSAAPPPPPPSACGRVPHAPCPSPPAHPTHPRAGLCARPQTLRGVLS